uniref:Immunoglobulin V-set domain-containing protein n=1 Tax=Coturnix japonica TaxID=93934 RepID=A0A8C2U2S5_COTJA
RLDTYLCFCFLTVFLLLCLTGAEITQPSSLVLKEDENATLKCSQNDNHDYMSWYLQQPGKGLQLMYYSYGENQDYKGDVHTGYEAKRLGKEDFHLDIVSVKKNHSAVYFCASSLDTTLQSHFLSVYKLLLSSTLPQKGVALSTGYWNVGQLDLHRAKVAEELDQERSSRLNLIAEFLFSDQLFILCHFITILTLC